MTSALLCLALAVYHEARGEPFRGQVAVAQVVMRRAALDDAKICHVVAIPRQFSPAVRRHAAGRAAWGRAVIAAQKAMLWAKGAGQDESRGADHFHSGAQPAWARSMWPVAVIGGHSFYRSRT